MPRYATFVGGPMAGRTATLYGYPPANRYRDDAGTRNGKTYELEDAPEGPIYRHNTWQEPAAEGSENPSPNPSETLSEPFSTPALEVRPLADEPGPVPTPRRRRASRKPKDI